ncbi:hypothetical protein [Corynebacterium lubricantis]|uniref:hypothetical protein n=1 Tax=Corynebacterium lubricantis TaxID=541095 RepID=UPI00037CAD74|nr:hypothetical protein [Corynebacterium lubricantis]
MDSKDFSISGFSGLVSIAGADDALVCGPDGCAPVGQVDQVDEVSEAGEGSSEDDPDSRQNAGTT